jgi:hypothetical protein
MVATLCSELVRSALDSSHDADCHLSNGEKGTQVITALRNTLGQHFRAVLITGDTSSAVQELQQDERLRLARKPIHAEEL